jgi:hypothetical protein
MNNGPQITLGMMSKIRVIRGPSQSSTGDERSPFKYSIVHRLHRMFNRKVEQVFWDGT